MAEMDPDRLTPREALEALYRLKALLPVSAAPGHSPITLRMRCPHPAERRRPPLIPDAPAALLRN